MKQNRFFKVIFLFALFFSCANSTKNDAPKNLYQTTLKNGLQVFVMESDAVPLAYIEIAIRGGGIGQTAETAGLFHLYEHMMFKGNAKYPTAAKVQRALNDLGCASWNGSTGSEFVNYFFTVPSDFAREGIEFWQQAICNPLLDEKEFESEKAVVISEIVGRQENPAWISHFAQMKTLFPNETWRLDSAGSPEIVKNATLETLKKIKAEFYVPNNAALFVGGNVRHNEIFKYARELFGDWKRAENPWKNPIKQFSQTPFSQTVLRVLPNPKVSANSANIQISLRGPDADFEIEDTYAADVLTHLLENPSGNFKNALANDARFQIPDVEYISSGYYTQRQAGEISVSATFLDSANDLPARATEFKAKIFDEMFCEISQNPNYFSIEDFQKIAQRIDDENLYSQATCAGFLETLRFWWATCGADYFFTYSENMRKVDGNAISNFAKKYLAEKPVLLVIEINPAVYAQTKSAFADAGFSEINAENAFWWQDTN